MSNKALKTYADRKNQTQAKKQEAAASSNVLFKQVSNDINILAGSSQITSASKPSVQVKKNLIFKNQARNKVLQPLISSTPIETKKSTKSVQAKKLDPFGFGR